MGASEQDIAMVERHFGQRMPDDYRHFLLTRGGMDEFVPPADDFLSICPIETIIENNRAGEIQQRFPGALVIGGDGSREMLAYDFRQNPPPLLLLDISAPNWSSGIYQASSFTVFLAQFSDRGWLFE
jgi:hypothetical protein